MPTFAQYLDQWLRQSTAQGLNNPLVKMPVKRFRPLQTPDFNSIANGGTLVLGTMADPIARNLHKNFQTRIRERGEHCAFVCFGSVEMTIAGGVDQQPRAALFPVCLKRVTLQMSGDRIKTIVDEEEPWRFNSVLEANLRAHGIRGVPNMAEGPERLTDWVRAQLGNRATQVRADSYVGLFSSQQMVVQQPLSESLFRQTLARNPVIKAKIDGGKVETAELGEITDDGLEELGLVLPCDDSQLRVVQLSKNGSCLQVEGPPGTGKSQTIANIISNALYHGRNALLVCDKRAAIVQVEERLTNCGLKPALLNLHDEDLNKRAFLDQANERFQADMFAPGRSAPANYPFDQLRESRKILNKRVKYGRGMAHPSLPVARRQALAGLIQLKKELQDVPTVQIPNWQSLSRDRLTKLLSSLSQWPGLAQVLGNGINIWNQVRPEAFDENPNAANELHDLCERVVARLQSLAEPQDWAATIGIETLLSSDIKVADVLTLAEAVLERPACHPRLDGNTDVTLAEVERLNAVWDQRENLKVARHPLSLTEIYLPEAEGEARDLLAFEGVNAWHDLSLREKYHAERHAEVEDSQARYRRLCDQIGLVYSPLLKVRRAQLQAVLNLGSFGGVIPRRWWGASVNPVLEVNGWLGSLRTCIGHSKAAPLPLNFIALDRVSSTHFAHVEAMAEHGFNLVSYCLKFVNDRKCKFALHQAYPAIPVRGFKHWREVTLHAVTAHQTVTHLRNAAAGHVILKQLTENYLSVAHELDSDGVRFVEHQDVRQLQNAAALVEQWRARNDLFEISNVHWQMFWESANPNLLAQAQALFSECDRLPLPNTQTDNVEEALRSYESARLRIQRFLQACEQEDGDRQQSVLAGFAAQKEYARCERKLLRLPRYLELQPDGQTHPDWPWLRKVIAWRDLFERLRGAQKLDVDSGLWSKLRDRLREHSAFMDDARAKLNEFIEDCLRKATDYESLRALIATILEEMPRYPLWLEKKRWEKKISAYPEIKGLLD